MSHYDKQIEQNVIEVTVYENRPKTCHLSKQLLELKKEITDMKNALIYFGIMEENDANK